MVYIYIVLYPGQVRLAFLISAARLIPTITTVIITVITSATVDSASFRPGCVTASTTAQVERTNTNVAVSSHSLDLRTGSYPPWKKDGSLQIPMRLDYRVIVRVTYSQQTIHRTVTGAKVTLFGLGNNRYASIPPFSGFFPCCKNCSFS